MLSPKASVGGRLLPLELLTIVALWLCCRSSGSASLVHRPVQPERVSPKTRGTSAGRARRSTITALDTFTNSRIVRRPKQRKP